MNFLIIDGVSMVPRELCADIDSNLGEVFMRISEKAFTSLSLVGFLQLDLVEKNLYF